MNIKPVMTRPFVRKVALGAMAVGAAMSINSCTMGNPVKKNYDEVYEYLLRSKQFSRPSTTSNSLNFQMVKALCDEYGTYYTAMYLQRRSDLTHFSEYLAMNGVNKTMLDGELYHVYKNRTETPPKEFRKAVPRELKELEKQDNLIFQNKKNKYPTADECIFHLDLIAQVDSRVDYKDYQNKSRTFSARQGEANSVKQANLIAYKQYLIDRYILIALMKDCGLEQTESAKDALFGTYNPEWRNTYTCFPEPNKRLDIVKK